MIPSGTTTIVTKLVGPNDDNHMCKVSVLVKTIISPDKGLTTWAKYTESSNGYWNNSATGDVVLFSLDGFFSDFTENIRAVGR